MGPGHLWPSPVLLGNAPFCPGMPSCALELSWFTSRSSCVGDGGTGRGGGALLMVTQPQEGMALGTVLPSQGEPRSASACRQLLGASAPRHTTSGASVTGKGMFVKQRAEERGSWPDAGPGCPQPAPSRGTGEVLTRQGKAAPGMSSTLPVNSDQATDYLCDREHARYLWAAVSYLRVTPTAWGGCEAR